MAVPELTNPRVLLETATGGSAPSKVICVSWELADTQKKIDGEWTVDWDNMYTEEEDVRSTGGGTYFALQQQELQQRGIVETAEFEEPIPMGPLSTARLLEFENGSMPEPQDDLPTFFATRPIVQAPTQILPDPTSVSRKTEALFLLAPDTPIPQAIRIFFTPTWSPPSTPPALLAEIKLLQYGTGEGLYAAWATRRHADLQVLQDIANELEREGSRGIGQGLLKVGVEGGGMDEEAVRREGWMVAEEQVWVVEKFLTAKQPETTAAAATPVVIDPFAGLGISTGLSFGLGSSVIALDPSLAEESEEEDLFALPLSPRSPDMTVSPFSFRGEPPTKSPLPGRYRNVGSIDANTASGTAGFGSLTPPQGGATAKAPPTPPNEAA